MPFTVPPDTRAVGTGNPPADMNGIVDALTSSGIAGNVMNAANAGGADPTGVADSSTAIGAAITAAGVNGTVYFPPGTYLAASLTPLTGQTWYGTATIKRPTASSQPVVTATGISGFTMRDLTIDGNAASAATSNGAIYLINCTGCLLVDVVVQNTPSTNPGIILRGTVRCIISNCVLTSVGYGILVGLNHGDAYSCYGNVVRGCTIDTTVWDAIFLTENFGSTTSVSVIGSVIGTVVSGCVVRNFGDCGIEIGSGSVYTEVSGCTFDGISNGNGNNGILFRDAVHSSVTGCTVSNLTKAGSAGVFMFNLNSSCQYNSINSVDVYNTGYGYVVSGGPDASTVGTAAAGITINGGNIDTTAIHGIKLSNVAGFSITGTNIHNAGGQGISVGTFGVSGSGCTDGTITGCRIFNSAQIAANNVGIILFQATADITITGCRIGDNQGTKTQKYGIQVFDATVTNITITGNDLTGNLTAAINSASTSVSGGLPAWGAGMTLLATTGTTGYTLVNGTGNIITWTAPSDGALHRVALFGALHVTSTETGGVIQTTYNLPDGTAATHTFLPGAAATGDATVQNVLLIPVQAGSTVVIKQSTALTAGAAIMWAEIWGS